MTIKSARQFIFLLPLVLQGCASSEDLLASKIDQTYTTSSKPEEVRDCVLAAHPALTVNQVKDTITIINNRTNVWSPVYLAQVKPAPQGSTVEVHVGGTMGNGDYFFDQEVKPCLTPH